MKKRLFYYIPAIVLFLSALLPEQKKTFFPVQTGKELPFKLQTYIDYQDTTRGSLGTLAMTDSVIVFDYTLRTVNNNPAIKPISGFTMMFDVKSTANFLDVSNYKYLDIDISMKDASSFMMYIKTFEHFTDTNDWKTQRFTEKEISLHPRETRHHLLFKDFSTPNWWKSLIGNRMLTLPKKPDYTKLMAIDFQNNPGSQLDIPERMEIRRVEFRKDRKLFYIFTIGCGILWCIICSFFLFVKKPKKGKSVSVTQKPIKQVALGNQSEEQLGRLATFIGSNFQTPELSVEVVSRETGISLPKISALLQKKYNVNFKQYLNDVRISESQRLLRETDRSIAEIAFAVGYNSIPHFNRVFRQHSNMTPTEFRDKKNQPSA